MSKALLAEAEFFRMIKLDRDIHAIMTGTKPAPISTPCGLPIPKPSDQLVATIAKLRTDGSKTEIVFQPDADTEGWAQEGEICASCRDTVLAVIGERVN